ncbi:Uncharacterised protein [Yersinia aldovae]|nr:Uncharacterised protein [Yersinia aldovae]
MLYLNMQDNIYFFSCNSLRPIALIYIGFHRGNVRRGILVCSDSGWWSCWMHL